VHLLLEEFRISLRSSLSTQSVRHTASPKVKDGVDFGSGVGVLNFLTSESESKSHNK